jgi:hypothetical protein
LRNTKNSLKKWNKKLNLKTQRRKMKMNMRKKKENNSLRNWCSALLRLNTELLKKLAED